MPINFRRMFRKEKQLILLPALVLLKYELLRTVDLLGAINIDGLIVLLLFRFFVLSQKTKSKHHNYQSGRVLRRRSRGKCVHEETSKGLKLVAGFGEQRKNDVFVQLAKLILRQLKKGTKTAPLRIWYCCRELSGCLSLFPPNRQFS